MIVVGESLIDLVPSGDGLLAPRSGGSARTLAIAAARLGGDVRYVGALSADPFGVRLRAEHDAEGVDTAGAPTVQQPTTLAVVHLDQQGVASYTFHLADTSALALRDEHLAQLPQHDGLHVSLGAITLATPGVGEALLALLERHPARSSLDPNVRPAFLTDVPAAAALLARAAAACDLVRCSEEDLELLHPHEHPDEVAQRWHAAGPAVVLTRGEGGATAWTAAGRLDVAAPTVADVVDTVGAGDTFGGALLVALDEAGATAKASLAALPLPTWEEALRFAAAAAAVTVARQGADPPRRAELPD